MAPKPLTKMELECKKYPGMCPCPDKIVKKEVLRAPCPEPNFPPCGPEEVSRRMNKFYGDRLPKIKGPAPDKPCPPPLWGPEPGKRMWSNLFHQGVVDAEQTFIQQRCVHDNNLDRVYVSMATTWQSQNNVSEALSNVYLIRWRCV